MPRPTKGQRIPGSGRKPGTPNHNSRKVQELLDSMGHNPHVGMAKIARNDVGCGVCRGSLVTRYNLDEPRDYCERCGGHRDDPSSSKGCIWCSGTGCQTINERTCQSCKGTGMESISPELRFKAESELAKYVQPQLKAIEHSNPDGSMRPKWEVVLAPEVKNLE